VSSITFIVSEGKFDWLIYKLTIVTNNKCRISCVVSAIVSNIASVKLPKILQIRSYCLIVSLKER